MSSASRSLAPDLFARPELRAARRDRAFLLLDEAMGTILYANLEGRLAFGISGGSAIPNLLARQVGSGARRVAKGETVRLLLRAPMGSSAALVAATLRRISTGSSSAILLASETCGANRPEDPNRLLVDLGLAEERVALLGRNGLLAAGVGFDSLAAEALATTARTMIENGTADDLATFDGLSARLLLFDDDMVLAALEEEDEASADRPAEAAGEPASATPEEGEATERDGAEPGLGPMNIAAIVGRWHSRQETPPTAQATAAAAPAPKRLRSQWGEPPAAAAGIADSDAAAVPPERLQAVPSDDRPDAASKTRQPLDDESAIILPDIGEEEAGLMDPALSPHEEQPVEGDLVPGEAEIGLPQAEPAVETDEETGEETGEEADGEPAASPAAEAEPAPPAFRADPGSAPVRFVWQIDGEGRFRSLSPEFADAVGPRAGDVLGRSFGEVADAFGFDGDGEIRRLLERRDTWSGRTVLWPVEGTSRRVPIDLAALPTYARDRSFDGFRGFGIVRGAESEEDPGALGLALPILDPAPMQAPEAEAEAVFAAPITAPGDPAPKSFESELPGVSFGRRQVPPQPPAPTEDATKVIRFAERRRPSESMLTASEEAAFREIGAKLGHGAAEAKTPGALRFESDVAPEDASETTSGTVPPSDGAEAALPSPVPDASALRDAAEAFDEAPTETETAAEPEALCDVEPFLAALPLPILVQGQSETVFANEALLEMAGYADLDAFNAAGGLDALFVATGGEASSGLMTLRHSDGSGREMRVHMQRIAFQGRSSLLMSFEPSQTADAALAAPQPNEAVEVRRELNELKAVLDIATDGVVLVDPEGVVRAVNGSAQALFGFSEDEFRGRPVASLFAHESQKSVLDYIETLKDKGLAGVLNDGREVIGRVAQGGFVPLFVTLGRLSEERGWCLVIRDMSHWKRIEEELVNARRTAEAASLHKSRFLANISHELRTPLNAIIGFADVMASECFGPIGNERYIEYLGDIKRSGHHVLDLVNDLLDISKIEAGKMELTFESVSLNEVIAEVVSVMQPQANRERVIVRSNLPPSVPPVVADRRTIRQIALNLLSNSVRFTPAGGQIIASTTYTAEGDVLLRVRDSGIGMTEREIEIALAPFQQVHQPGTGRGEGTGLGLPLTKAMAEANRASFAIRSTPGEGTLVEIGFSAQRVLAD